MRRPSNAPFLALALVSFASAALMGCPPGTKTAVEFTVKVTANGCAEDKAFVDNETVALDCAAEAGGTIKVQFPRRQWWAIKAAQHGSVDPGPGK